jgi:hypothetical protein
MPMAFAAEGVQTSAYQHRGWYIGPWRGGVAPDRMPRWSGTTTSSAVKSRLPAPRMPIPCQVSTMVTCPRARPPPRLGYQPKSVGRSPTSTLPALS